MSFWDSSALLPLVMDEPASSSARRVSQLHGVPVVWWGSLIECRSALERRHRAGQLARDQKRQAEQLLRQLAVAWTEVEPTPALREHALRLLSLHDLRTADAWQLSAALIWAGHQPFGRIFVCLDVHLRECADREGFALLP